MVEGAIREIVSELGIEIITRNGSGWLVARCPFAELGFHERGIDRDPSFFIRPNGTGVSGFNCFTCKQHGTVSSLIKKLEHHSGRSYGNLSTRAHLLESQVDFGEYGEWDDEDRPPEYLDEEVYAGVYSFVWENDRAMEYLASRGLGKEAAQTMGLLYDDEGLRILFPVRDYEGRLWGFSGRSVLPDEVRRNAKVKDYAGLKKKWVILGENLVKESDERCELVCVKRKPIMPVEGLFAFAHMVQIGARDIINPIAVLGSSLSVHQRDRLIALDRTNYFLFDDDLAGDIGLYGQQDKDTKEHLGGGALDLMKAHLPTVRCDYPDRFALGEADPDLLTFEDLEWVLKEGSTLYS